MKAPPDKHQQDYLAIRTTDLNFVTALLWASSAVLWGATGDSGIACLNLGVAVLYTAMGVRGRMKSS